MCPTPKQLFLPRNSLSLAVLTLEYMSTARNSFSKENSIQYVCSAHCDSKHVTVLCLWSLFVKESSIIFFIFFAKEGRLVVKSFSGPIRTKIKCKYRLESFVISKD